MPAKRRPVRGARRGKAKLDRKTKAAIKALDPNAKPRYDRHRRELWLGDFLVKRFRVPAGNQELILMAFEEEGWPEHLDDPLPPQPGHDPKRRLHDTIDRLNRSQFHQLLRFRGNGTARSILWESVSKLAG